MRSTQPASALYQAALAKEYNEQKWIGSYAMLQRAPIAGRVCMDQIVVDVSETPEVRVGEEAVLFGRQGEAELRIGEVARQAGTISYDLLCLAGQLNPRLYV